MGMQISKFSFALDGKKTDLKFSLIPGVKLWCNIFV